MISAKKKGDERENKVANFLKEQEYEVMVSPRTMRKVGNRYFSMRNDFFELFDICAKKELITRWIQVKSHISDYYKARKEIAKFEKNCCNHEVLEIWVRKKVKGNIFWRIYIYDPTLDEWKVLMVLNNKFEKV